MIMTMRQPGTSFQDQPVNFDFAKRGIGDIICAVKVIQTMRKNWPHVKPILWVPDFVVGLLEHMLRDHLEDVAVFGWSERQTHMKNFPVKSFRGQKLNSWRVPLMKHSYLWMCDYYPEDDEISYPIFHTKPLWVNHFSLPDKYAVIITSHNAKNKEFYVTYIRKIGKWLRQRGVTPVFIGKTEEKFFHKGEYKRTSFGGSKHFLGSGVNLVDKTNLLEAGAIMAGSSVVIGNDGGLIHLSACTDVPIVCGFNVVTPRLFTPTRNGKFGRDFYPVVPDENLGCRFCHSQVNFVNQADVFECYYGDLKCLNQMTADKYIEQLEKIL